MGDGSLSQDEIDALLNMADDADAGDAAGDLNLDSLIGGGDSAPEASDMGGGGGGLDQAALDALAGAVGGSPAPSPQGRTPAPSGGGNGIDHQGPGSENVDLLMDVTLRFIVELGRTHMYIKDVLQLAEGSIVELDKNAGDEVDILVNERIFGRGKLIVMDEYFAVQITHIIDPMERFRLLK